MWTNQWKYNIGFNERLLDSFIPFEMNQQIETKITMYKYFKRFVDFVIALVALIILFIPLVIVAILIKLNSKGPVIFKQVRLGKDGVPFKIWKFRSMCVGAEKQGTGVYSYKGDARITKG